jgi:hypothetical protein
VKLSTTLHIDVGLSSNHNLPTNSPIAISRRSECSRTVNVGEFTSSEAVSAATRTKHEHAFSAGTFATTPIDLERHPSCDSPLNTSHQNYRIEHRPLSHRVHTATHEAMANLEDISERLRKTSHLTKFSNDSSESVDASDESDL